MYRGHKGIISLILIPTPTLGFRAFGALCFKSLGCRICGSFLWARADSERDTALFSGFVLPKGCYVVPFGVVC